MSKMSTKHGNNVAVSTWIHGYANHLSMMQNASIVETTW